MSPEEDPPWPDPSDPLAAFGMTDEERTALHHGERVARRNPKKRDGFCARNLAILARVLRRFLRDLPYLSRHSTERGDDDTPAP